jgi:hypothetical protein
LGKYRFYSISIVLACFITLLIVTPAYAISKTSKATAEILPGPLYMTTTSPLSVEQTGYGYGLVMRPFTVVDATGSGNGWHVMASVISALPSNCVYIQTDDVTPSADQTKNYPTNLPGLNCLEQYSLPIINANSNYGMGSWSVGSCRLYVFVPIDHRNETISLSITLTLQSGPAW